jgi:hypothetical protein
MNSSELLGTAGGLIRTLVLVLACTFSVPSLAANYPLELLSPRAVGTVPTAGGVAITAENRIYKAYPGLEYNIRANVIGGAYPYTFSLSNAPAGMTINANTGTIVWPNPQANATPTIVVTDSEGTRVTSNWAITVTTSGFHFIDGVNGRSQPTGTGTLTNPWRNISDMIASSSAVGGNIAYFRNGTYDASGLQRSGVGGEWERVEFSSSRKPGVWIAYPGETPLIDFGFVPGGDPGVLFRMGGSDVYVDGFETRNSRIIGFQTGHGAYNVFRRLRMRDHNVILANLDGSNASYIMTLRGDGVYGHYLAIQDCEFFNAPMDMGLKIYGQRKLLIEGNSFHGMSYGTELKADMPQFTYRNNRHWDITRHAIGGNMHVETTSGEILFNLANVPSGLFALDVNQDGMAKRIDVYRNTFVGRVQVRNVDSADGPFNFYNNVIVSTDSGTPAGSHIHHQMVNDPSRITSSLNLAGYPTSGIVDGSGALTSGYSQYIGSRGYQIGAAVPPPSPPANIIIE